jgi:hypothetical protein
MKKRYSASQTTLEFAFCFVVLMLLFIAAFLAFKWAVGNIATRQRAFENSRGGMPPTDFYSAPPLNIVPEIPPRNP